MILINEDHLATNSKNTHIFKERYLGIIGFFYFGQGYSLASLVLLLPIYIHEELGAKSYSQSVAISALIIFPWYFKVFFGILSDNFPIGKFGRRKPYLLISTLFSLYGWLTLGTQSSPNLAFIISGVSLAIGSAMADSTVDAQSVEITPIQYAGRLQGIAWGARGLGIGLTGIVSALIVSMFEWQTMFLVSAVFGISISIVALLLPQLAKSRYNIQNPPISIVDSLKLILFQENSKSKFSFFFISGLGLAIVPLISIIMDRDFDYGIRTIGFVAFAFAIGAFFGSIVNGIILDKTETLSRIKLLFFGYSVVIIFSLMFFFTSNFQLQVFYIFLIGVTSGAYEAFQLKVIQENVLEGYEGTSFAMYTSFSNIGQFALGGVIIAYFADLFNTKIFLPLQISTIFVVFSFYLVKKIKFEDSEI